MDNLHSFVRLAAAVLDRCRRNNYRTVGAGKRQGFILGLPKHGVRNTRAM